MTPEEREWLKVRVDRARRARIEHKAICHYCDQEFVPAKTAGARQRFCCATHRKAWWQRETERGRELQAGYKRRRRAQLRAQTQLPAAA